MCESRLISGNVLKWIYEIFTVSYCRRHKHVHVCMFKGALYIKLWAIILKWCNHDLKSFFSQFIQRGSITATWCKTSNNRGPCGILCSVPFYCCSIFCSFVVTPTHTHTHAHITVKSIFYITKENRCQWAQSIIQFRFIYHKNCSQLIWTLNPPTRKKSNFSKSFAKDKDSEVKEWKVL